MHPHPAAPASLLALILLFTANPAQAFSQAENPGRIPLYDDILSQYIGAGRYALHDEDANPLAAAALNPGRESPAVTLSPVVATFSNGEAMNYDALGWRIGTRFGAIAPYAQIAYLSPTDESAQPYAFTSPATTHATPGVDVTVGASLPLTDGLGAFAAVSQTDGLNSGEQFLYSIGVSARF